MNILNVSLQHSISTLAAGGWSRRRIARELGVNRETVGKYLRLERSKPAILTLGSESDPDPKPAISTAGSGRQSSCLAWRAQIEAAAAVGLSAQRIYQDLVCEHGFAGSYQAVKRFVRPLRQSPPAPCVRMEVEAGAEAQVDFGMGAWVMVEGKRRRPHLFRIVLSHSRKAYSEVVWRQTTESFIRCLENAFRYFGGVARTLVVDNLRAAVTRADWFDPELNRKVEEFCRHYGTVMLPTRPAMPQHKGKVEAGVKYVQNNALQGRCFESLSAQNRLLADWERTVARAYYSVPPEYVGRQVWVRWEARLVRVFNQRHEPIAVHVRTEPGKFATDPQHLHSPYRRVVQQSLDYLLDRARLIGKHTGSWAEAMTQQRGPAGMRVLHGLLSLAGKHPVAALEKAAAKALHHGTWRLRDLRTLLEQAGPAPQLDFLETHPLIRQLDVYEALTPDCFNPQPQPTHECP